MLHQCPLLSLLAAWLVMGIGYTMMLTRSWRAVRRSSTPGDRPALFAAQFSLSHTCRPITCPLAGWVSARARLSVSFMNPGGVETGLLLAATLRARPNPIHRFQSSRAIRAGRCRRVLNGTENEFQIIG